MTRRSRRMLSWIVAGALLYGQIAIAAYACPRLVPASDVVQRVASIAPAADMTSDATEQPASAPMGNCAGGIGTMDRSSVNLCAEHCKYGEQSERAPTVSVPAVLLTTLYIAPAIPEPTVSPHPAADAGSALAAASPPHAILHCCFRI